MPDIILGHAFHLDFVYIGQCCAVERSVLGLPGDRVGTVAVLAAFTLDISFFSFLLEMPPSVEEGHPSDLALPALTSRLQRCLRSCLRDRQFPIRPQVIP